MLIRAYYFIHTFDTKINFKCNELLKICISFKKTAQHINISHENNNTFSYFLHTYTVSVNTS